MGDNVRLEQEIVVDTPKRGRPSKNPYTAQAKYYLKIKDDPEIKQRRREKALAYYRNNPEAKEKTRERKRKYRQENKEHEKILQRRWSLWKYYKIREADYDALLAQQNGLCAICGTNDPCRKDSKFLSVDHCHATGKVRGLLCSKCNFGLGGFNDSTENLIAAIKYLEKHNEIS